MSNVRWSDQSTALNWFGAGTSGIFTRRGTKLQMAAPLKGACALGFASKTGHGRSQLLAGLIPTLPFCVATITGARRIEVSGLIQATLSNAPCAPK